MLDPFVVAHVALRSSRARRLRLLLRTAAWLAATTLLSRVPLPVPGAPAAVANLGACAAVLATLAWIRRDVASALLVGAHRGVGVAALRGVGAERRRRRPHRRVAAVLVR